MATMREKEISYNARRLAQQYRDEPINVPVELTVEQCCYFLGLTKEEFWRQYHASKANQKMRFYGHPVHLVWWEPRRPL